MVSRSLASSIHNAAPASRHAHHAPPPNPQRGRADLDRASLSSATATLCEEPVKVVPVAVPSSTPDQLALAAHQAALINQFFGGGRYEEHRLALDVQPSHEARAQKKAKRHADGKPRSWSKRLFTLGWVFPPLWVIGMAIPLLTAKKATSQRDLEDPTLAQDEHTHSDQAIHQTEVVWAKRCAWALAVLTIVIIALVVALVLTAH
ncbi:hypothetical protein WOLCODRAFT_152926 [Wolfiporia cocos MD-104 SS10]|uniref:Uncharacterized protein n=1 Tax=Wolfiporia cocos (strain MD-104) TaxID=742152 RepID=A0A2H3JVE0_WOLCO|nr:hypothetical protein WOLCODRAFT_152926 [Wolfiporia cocos MD-104 SS10]